MAALYVFAALGVVAAAATSEPANTGMITIVHTDTVHHTRVAARELRRAMYLITGAVPQVAQDGRVDALAARVAAGPSVILVGPASSDRAGHELARILDPTWSSMALDAGTQHKGATGTSTMTTPDDHFLHSIEVPTLAANNNTSTTTTIATHPVVLLHGATPLAVK